MKTTYYRQCHLTRKTEAGKLEQTTWIPEKYAVLGKILKLKENNVWINGWIVESAGINLVKEDLLPDYHDEIKGHRKATGDVS